MAERLWRHIRREPPGCWVWLGGNDGVYGCIHIEGRKVKAHRAMYELIVGPIPEGLQLDHLCRNPVCVNPSHLEPVTPLENTRRSSGFGSETHCPQGHPYSGDNLYEYLAKDGYVHRYCRTCIRARDRARARARR